MSDRVPNGGVIVDGQVWTASQWNNAWTAKIDATAGYSLNQTLDNPTLNGASYTGSQTFSSINVTGGTLNGGTAIATGSSASRSLPDRFGDVLNILDFGADPTGVVDSTPAYQGARDRYPSGTYVKIWVPPGIYRADSTWNENGRFVWLDLDPDARVGASFGGTGTGIVFVSRTTQVKGGTFNLVTQGGANSGTSQGIGQSEIVQNTGGTAGSGFYRNYVNTNGAPTNSNGGDIGHQDSSIWKHQFDCQMFGRWTTAAPPVVDANAVTNGYHWGMRLEEQNPVYNGPDNGYQTIDGQATWGSGHLSKPDIWDPTGSYGGNINSAYQVRPSGTANKRWTSYPAVFGSTSPTALSGTDAFTVNGTAISGWTTGNASEVASKIVAASIANTSASVDSFGRLVIYMTTANNAGSLVLANSVGTPLAKLGLTAGTFTVMKGYTVVGTNPNPPSVGTSTAISINGTTISLNVGTGAPTDVATAINNAHIASTTSWVSALGRLFIVNTASTPLTLANVIGTPLATLGLPTGTIQPAFPPTATFPDLAKSYNGLLIGLDAIAPTGMGVRIGGDDTGDSARYPSNPLLIEGTWSHGIDTTAATFIDNVAINADVGTNLAFTTGTFAAKFSGTGSGSNVSAVITPSGTGAFLGQVPDSTATGGNARGSGAIDFQMVRNSATQVASGDQSAIACGKNNTASGLQSFAGGSSSIASGSQSFAFGNQASASANLAVALGSGPSSARIGSLAFASGSFSTAGDAQYVQAVLRAATTDATATRMTSDGSAASTSNILNPVNNSCITARGLLVARNTSTADTVVWDISALVLKRGAGANTVALLGTPTVTKVQNDSGASTWTVAISADTTNGGLNVTVTGAAATNIHWVFQMTCAEVK